MPMRPSAPDTGRPETRTPGFLTWWKRRRHRIADSQSAAETLWQGDFDQAPDVALCNCRRYAWNPSCPIHGRDAA